MPQRSGSKGVCIAFCTEHDAVSHPARHNGRQRILLSEQRQHTWPGKMTRGSSLLVRKRSLSDEGRAYCWWDLFCVFAWILEQNGWQVGCQSPRLETKIKLNPHEPKKCSWLAGQLRHLWYKSVNTFLSTAMTSWRNVDRLKFQPLEQY